jgi:hypothetical protein
MKDANGSLSYRAVQKNELDACEGAIFVPAVLFLKFLTGKRD